ncbi:flavin mononucleotide phosphatase [Erysipelotrichaceae bacterium]|nr:flavin mononucleotide phosphatase [Erysipelotrichaceae bacterium]
MSKKIKLIVMDVDGTLVNNKKAMTPKTVEALIRAQKAGIQLVLASGRSTTGLGGYAKQLEMENYGGMLISYNGSTVVDFKTGEVLFNEPMSPEEVQAVIAHVKKFDLTIMIDNEATLYVENRDGYMVDYESSSNNYILAQIDDFTKDFPYGSNKVLTSGEPEYLKTIYEDLKSPFEKTLTCMFTAPVYIEYTAQGIDKAKALDFLLTHKGMSREDIIVFGDGHNDISMFEYAQTTVAMGNAVEELKAIATSVTTSNEEDGIADALEIYLK